MWFLLPPGAIETKGAGGKISSFRREDRLAAPLEHRADSCTTTHAVPLCVLSQQQLQGAIDAAFDKRMKAAEITRLKKAVSCVVCTCVHLPPIA